MNSPGLMSQVIPSSASFSVSGYLYFKFSTFPIK
nr:MAG TPA: hypothetical protein [Crassvirales sp.]